jgi:hypothetical protein
MSLRNKLLYFISTVLIVLSVLVVGYIGGVKVGFIDINDVDNEESDSRSNYLSLVEIRLLSVSVSRLDATNTNYENDLNLHKQKMLVILDSELVRVDTMNDPKKDLYKEFLLNYMEMVSDEGLGPKTFKEGEGLALLTELSNWIVYFTARE